MDLESKTYCMPNFKITVESIGYILLIMHVLTVKYFEITLLLFPPVTPPSHHDGAVSSAKQLMSFATPVNQ